jgi:hypothetical protein
MVGLCVISSLYELYRVDLLEKGVRALLLEQCFDVLEHGFTEGPLQDDLVCALVG